MCHFQGGVAHGREERGFSKSKQFGEKSKDEQKADLEKFPGEEKSVRNQNCQGEKKGRGLRAFT